MKRIVLAFLLIAVMSALSADFYPIIFGGCGLTWFSGEVFEDAESVFGFMGGVAFELDNAAPIIWEFGTRYRTAGALYSEEYRYVTYSHKWTWEYSFSYIDIFGKTKYEIPLSGYMYLFPYVGYATGLLLTADLEVDGEIYEFADDMYSSINHTLLFGVDFLIGNRFILGVEYNLGLSPLFDGAWGEYYNARINALICKLGLMF